MWRRLVYQKAYLCVYSAKHISSPPLAVGDQDPIEYNVA